MEAVEGVLLQGSGGSGWGGGRAGLGEGELGRVEVSLPSSSFSSRPSEVVEAETNFDSLSAAR